MKTALNQCAMCRRYTLSRPGVPSLHCSRVNFEHPFHYNVGHFTVHVWLKDSEEDMKIYLLLFTCLNVSAFHRELVPDMSILYFFHAFIHLPTWYYL